MSLKKAACILSLVICSAIPLPVFAVVTAISFDCNGKATDDLVVGDVVSIVHTFDQTGNFAHALVSTTSGNQLLSAVGNTNYVAGVPTTVTHTLTVTPVPGTLRFAIAFFNDNVLVVCPPIGVDLVIDKSVNDPNPEVGDTVTFSVMVENLGPSAATNVLVNDVVPAGFVYVAGTMTGISPPAAGITADESSPTGSGLEWTINSLPAAPAAGSSATLTFQAVVQPP